VFTAGDLMLWRGFPYPRDPGSENKDRYFIFLGSSSRFSAPVFAYLCTTTTKLQYYERGGLKFNNAFHTFRAGECGFPRQCVLDLDSNLYRDITEGNLNSHATDISKIGSIPHDTLRRIWNLIRPLTCKGIPPIVKDDIHRALNNAGLSGLKQPERRHN
jgi:hypothetical protein